MFSMLRDTGPKVYVVPFSYLKVKVTDLEFLCKCFVLRVF